MMPGLWGAICALLWFVSGLCSASPGGSPGPVVNDLDGIPRHPLDPGQKLASVLIFYWHDCPVCNSYAPEISRIRASYTNFAFYIVQVDPDLNQAAAREHAWQYDLRAPALLDPKHRLVEKAKATVTPEAVVLGRNGQLMYRGRIDDLYASPGKKRAAPKQHDLRDALDAIAARKPIMRRETKAVGCLIQSSSSL